MSTDLANVQEEASLDVPQSGAINADSARALAEVKAAIFLARQFPRDEVRATEKIVVDCGDKAIASKAIYTYARGGTDISGPSIRLAELIARRWGNLQFGVRELEQRKGESIVEAYAWDTENNVRDAKVFTIPHEIGLKGGKIKKLTDPRDVYELVANQGARRKRASILAIIPSHVVDAALAQTQKTLALTFTVSDESIKKMLEEFEQYGVSRASIEARIQRRIDAITPALMVQMKGILNSLSDGMSVPADHFSDLTIVTDMTFPEEVLELANRAHWPENMLVAQAKRFGGDMGALREQLVKIVDRTESGSRARARSGKGADETITPAEERPASFDEVPGSDEPGSITAATRGTLFGALSRRGITERAERIAWARANNLKVNPRKGAPKNEPSFANLSERDALKGLDIVTVIVGDERRDRVVKAVCVACGNVRGNAHDRECPIDETDEVTQ